MLRLLGKQVRLFEPLFHNTVNATIVQGGEKINVIPSEVNLALDGRLLPGHSPQELIDELYELVGGGVEIELIHHDPGPAEVDMGLYDLLAGVLCEFDPQGIPVPMLLPAVTDGRFFSRLGIQTYGFTPMKLPTDFRFFETVHAANERVPMEALDFGTQAIYRLFQRYGEAIS